MGMFKDMRDLSKQGKDMRKNWDPGAQMQQAKARMAEVSQSMYQQTVAAGLLTTGSRARATITAVTDTGMYLNMQPVLRIDLLVMADGSPPMPASTEGPLGPGLLGRATVGGSVEVAFDAASPGTVAIDWTKP